MKVLFIMHLIDILIKKTKKFPNSLFLYDYFSFLFSCFLFISQCSFENLTLNSKKKKKNRKKRERGREKVSNCCFSMKNYITILSFFIYLFLLEHLFSIILVLSFYIFFYLYFRCLCSSIFVFVPYIYIFLHSAHNGEVLFLTVIFQNQ
jgi:hypothetical protein